MLHRAVLLGLAISSIARAEPAPRLSLARALAVATDQNPTLATATLAIAAAAGEQRRARGAFDVTLEATSAVHRDHHDPRQTELPQSLEADQLRGSLTMRKRTAAGTQLAVTLAGIRARETRRFVSQGLPEDLATTTVSPRLDLELVQALRGGRHVARERLAALALQRSAAEAEREAAAATVARAVIRAYYELAFTERELAIREATGQAAAAQLRLVRLEIERGARPRQAADDIEEEAARRREDVLIATTALGERSLELARLLGIAPTTALRAEPLPEGPGVAEPPSDVLARVLDRDPRIVAALARGDAAARELAATADEQRWQLDAFVRGGIGADADRVDEALRATGAYQGWSIEAGLTIRGSLGGHTRHGALDAARARLVQQRVAVADVQADVARETQRELARLAIARERRATLARSIELAQDNLAAEQRRWERGDSSTFELLRRQTLLAEAQLRSARATTDALASAAALAVTLEAR